MNESKKKIDEAWKETIEKQRQSEIPREEKQQRPEPDFPFFITTLGLQASIALGRVPNPATNKKEMDLSQAKFLIDTLGMLKEKTRGNLNNEESRLLENLLYDLRMEYVAKKEVK